MEFKQLGNEENEKKFYQREMEDYTREDLLKNVSKDYGKLISRNPLYYWDRPSIKASFPIMRICAMKYLIKQCGSHPAEGLFSRSGHVINIKRNRLGDVPSTTLVEGKESY